jgi:ribosomal protein S18 acetylase RimI-like enzyme
MPSSSNGSCTSRVPVRLRELRATDKGRLERILRATEAFPDHEVSVALELIENGLASSPAGAPPAADAYRFLVAELADAAEAEPGGAPRVIGYVCWGRNPMSDGVFDVYWVAVDPQFGGGGAGRALMAAAEADVRASGGRMVLVETGGKPSYAATRAFYERLGYVVLARLPDFFRVGDDKLIFGRRFDGVDLRATVPCVAAAAVAGRG